MTLQAVGVNKLALHGGRVCVAKGTYHAQPNTWNTWHYAFPEKRRHGGDIAPTAGYMTEQ